KETGQSDYISDDVKRGNNEEKAKVGSRRATRDGVHATRSDCQVDKREIGTWAGNKGMDSAGAALLSGMDEGDAYLPRVHLFVTHAKILHSMSTHEIGGQGWVDELRVDRGACNPGLKLLVHGISRWRTGWAAGRTQWSSTHRRSARPVCFS
ncbi:hypothetical protein B0H14DRAFT_2836848, partial [Mycena olivaceomarginata]